MTRTSLFRMVPKMTLMHAAILTSIVFHRLALAKPFTTEIDPELTAGHYEGDMLLTQQQQVLMISKSSTTMARNGLIDETKRWPDGKVYYKIIGDFDGDHRAEIMGAINVIEARTCLRFYEAGDVRQDYVAIGSKPGGCFTAVGYQGGQQEMNLAIYPIGEGCFRLGTILHEFMHALGFYHQQSATDRDDYIRVAYENIIPGKEFNFKKFSSNILTDFDVGYDYDSCLHYRAGAFSINGEDTIVPLDRSANIGQRTGLSRKDIDKINIMYKCPVKT